MQQLAQIVLDDCAKSGGTITHLHMWLSKWPLPHSVNTGVKKRPVRFPFLNSLVYTHKRLQYFYLIAVWRAPTFQEIAGEPQRWNGKLQILVFLRVYYWAFTIFLTLIMEWFCNKYSGVYINSSGLLCENGIRSCRLLFQDPIPTFSVLKTLLSLPKSQISRNFKVQNLKIG